MTRVRASDADAEEFGRVMYYLAEDVADKFVIDANTVRVIFFFTHIPSGCFR